MSDGQEQKKSRRQRVRLDTERPVRNLGERQGNIENNIPSPCLPIALWFGILFLLCDKLKFREEVSYAYFTKIGGYDS